MPDVIESDAALRRCCLNKMHEIIAVRNARKKSRKHDVYISFTARSAHNKKTQTMSEFFSRALEDSNSRPFGP